MNTTAAAGMLGSSTDRPSVAPCSSARGHRLLNVEDVARCLDVTPRWVYAEANAGRLPHVKVGRFFRFKPESIEDWLAANERGTVG